MRFNWKKILLCTVDVVIGGYLVVAVTAFNKPDEARSVPIFGESDMMR